MIKKYFLLAALVLGFIITISCAHSTPTSLEENWGKAHRMQKKSQILNSGAGKDVSPVTGLDGKTGEKILDTYRSGSQEKTSSTTIGTLKITN